jgi:hypothetical protein
LRTARSLVLLVPLLGGCGLTVTNDRPGFEALAPEEQSAVDVVLGELRSFDAGIKATRGCSIAEILDRASIDVSFDGLIVAENLADNVVHVAAWENLSGAQQALVQSWFGASTPAAAGAIYKKLFYQFLGVDQGAKQFIYKALEVPWLMGHRSLFNLEKDAIRITIAHYDGVGRGAEMRSFVTQSCAPLLASQAAVWGPRFDNGKEYLKDPFNLHELFNPEAPVGYLYFVCRWARLGMDGPESAESLGGELDWILGLRDRRCQAGAVVNVSGTSP